ncbi:Tetrahydroberberine oxidase [Linum grandiflorum]
MVSALSLLSTLSLVLFPLQVQVVVSGPLSEQAAFLQCLSSFSTMSSNTVFSPNTSPVSFSNVLDSSTQNKRFEPSTIGVNKLPLFIIRPSNISHVGFVVICARSHGVQLLVRSGGHDYEGLSYVSPRPFVVLDFASLSAMNVDPVARSAWVESGATVGQLYYEIGRASSTLAFPAGICPTVGVGGHFSGGGYGTLLRYAGLAANHVTDVLVVDSNGHHQDRRSLGEDVFWAKGDGEEEATHFVVA